MIFLLRLRPDSTSEFTQLVSKSKADDSGEASFLIEGSTDRFQVSIRWPYNEGECGLKVDWSGIDLDKYVVFPPAASGDNQGELGWIHNGYLTLFIIEKGFLQSLQVSNFFPHIKLLKFAYFWLFSHINVTLDSDSIKVIIMAKIDCLVDTASNL